MLFKVGMPFLSSKKENEIKHILPEHSVSLLLTDSTLITQLLSYLSTNLEM